MRFTNSLELLPLGYRAWGINAQGDMLGGALYTDDWGAIHLDDLIDTTDPDAAEWFSPDRAYSSTSQISDRIAGPDFPGIGAIVVYNNLPDRLCLLKPVAVNP